MRLHIVARGKIGRSAEAALVDRYLERISWPTTVTECAETGQIILPPAKGLVKNVVLDERGTVLSSVALAQKLGAWRDDGVREVRFFIGAADGHDDATRGSADFLLSFGLATWPHMLARAMLAEQLYRASTIIANHPYHREG